MSAYLNGKRFDDINEYHYACRGCRELKTDKELIAYAKKATSNWYGAGWHRTFITYCFSGFDQSRYHLTNKEFSRLIELQKMAEKALKGMQAARAWNLSKTYYYADNSVEEIWEDQYGNTETRMTVFSHGDVC